MSYSHLCISAPRTQIEQLPGKNIELKGFRQNMVFSYHYEMYFFSILVQFYAVG